MFGEAFPLHLFVRAVAARMSTIDLFGRPKKCICYFIVKTLLKDK